MDFTSKRRPDPMRAHGAWVYLFASVGAGALLAADQGLVQSLLVGTGFAGGFLVAGAIAVGTRKRVRQLCLGIAVAILAPAAGLALGADKRFLIVAACSAIPALGAMLLADRLGYFSRCALAAGIAALAMAAPASAVAGGASLVRAGSLFLFLWAFYCWRSVRLAKQLGSHVGWNRERLRKRGLQEAGAASLWTMAVVIGMHWA